MNDRNKVLSFVSKCKLRMGVGWIDTGIWLVGWSVDLINIYAGKKNAPVALFSGLCTFRTSN